MAISKYVKLSGSALNKIENIKNIIYKNSGQNLDESKLFRFLIYRGLDEIDIEDLNSLPKEFFKNPKGYIKLRDAIFGMEED